MSGSGRRDATSCTKAACSSGGRRSRFGRQDHRAHEGLERLARLEAGRFVGQPAFDVDEAGRIQAADGRHRRLVVGRAEPAVADRRQRALDRVDVADAAALGDEPAARPEDGGQVPEQRVVVGHPVEGRGRQDRIDRPVDRQAAARGRRRRIRSRSPKGASRSRAASIIDGEPSRATTRPSRQALRQQLGDAARSRSPRRAPVRRRRAAGGRGPRSPSASAGRRPGRRSGRPSRGSSAARSASDGRSGGLGGRRGGRAGTFAQAVPSDTSAPIASSPAQTSIARWKASIDAWFEAAICAAVAPAAGGLSGWNAARTAGSSVSSPAAEPSDA